MRANCPVLGPTRPASSAIESSSRGPTPSEANGRTVLELSETCRRRPAARPEPGVRVVEEQVVQEVEEIQLVQFGPESEAAYGGKTVAPILRRN